MSTNSNKIIFYMGEETKPIIEEDIKESIFKDKIERAIDLVKEDIERNKKSEDSQNCNKNDDRLKEYDNNIIAFIGDRGSGKTSCMLTVREQLRREQLKKDFNISIHTMDSIDPSYFDDRNNIIELLISMICKDIEETISDHDKCKKIDKEDIHKIKGQLQNLKGYLRYLDKEKNKFDEGDELEDLASLGSAQYIKNTLKELIDIYLDIKDKKHLLICIDDIDLNNAQAYKLVEQIRKYLIIPNATILMAFKMEQLSDVIKIQLTNDFNVLLNKNATYTKNINEMTERYLTKLFPLKRRIYMDLEDDFFGRELEIWESHEKKKKEKISGTVSNVIPELIFNRTRYVFYNSLGAMSLIIPRNLRALRMLVALLTSMEEDTETSYIYADKEEKSRQNRNREKFRHYLFETYTESFPTEYKNIANSLIAEKDLSQLNKETISLLKIQGLIGQEKSEAGTSNIQDKTEEYSTMKQIIDDRNATYNVSLADCFYILDYIERTKYDLDTKKLIFFIKSLYSVRLYDCYCSMIDGDDKEKGNRFTTDYGNLSEINRMQQLIGGAYFNIDENTIIPPNKNGKRRDLRLIDGEVINKDISDIIKKYKVSNAPEERVSNSTEYSDKVNSEKTVSFKKIEDENDARKLQILEFAMLTTSKYIETKDAGNDIKRYNHRLRTEVYYNRNLTEVGNILFDISSIFFNLLDVERCYRRFNNDIFKFTVGEPRSLYYQLVSNMTEDEEEKINEKYSEEGDKKEEAKRKLLMSKVCIRNSEFVNVFFKWMRERREKVGKQAYGNDLIDFTEAFFRKQEFTGKEEKDKSLEYISTINSALKPISDCLSKGRNNENAKNLFGDIFSSNEMTVEEFFQKNDWEKDYNITTVIKKYNKYRVHSGKKELADKEKSELRTKLKENIVEGTNERVHFNFYIAVLKTFDSEH